MRHDPVIEPRIRPATADEWLDLYMVGLLHLRNLRPKVLSRAGMSVYFAIHLSGCITDAQHRSRRTDFKLISAAMNQAQVHKCDRLPGNPALRGLIGTSPQRLIILAVGDETLQYARIFGSQGYNIALTTVGAAYAERLLPQYADTLNEEQFAAGWELYLTRNKRTQVFSRIGAGPTM